MFVQFQFPSNRGNDIKLEQAAQTGWRVTILGDNQTPSGHSNVLGSRWPCLDREVDQITSRGPLLPQPLSDKMMLPTPANF